MGFWKDRWEDIRGHLLWQIVVWVCGGGLVTAVFQAIRNWQHLPFEWWFSVAVFLISSLALGVVMLVARTRNQVTQADIVQTERAASLTTPSSTFNATEYFRTAYYSPLQDEIRKNICAAANATQPNDREGFFLKVISIGVMGYLYDTTWFTIYRSQLLFLLELNHKNGLLPLRIAQTYYDKAVLDHPVAYEKYSFDQWLNYMKVQLLILMHPSDMIEITVRGKDFLKYLVHWGRTPDQRSL